MQEQFSNHKLKKYFPKALNCKRCHHISEAHESSENSESLLKLGKCSVPGCTCRQYVEFEQLDEELL